MNEYFNLESIKDFFKVREDGEYSKEQVKATAVQSGMALATFIIVVLTLHYVGVI